MQQAKQKKEQVLINKVRIALNKGSTILFRYYHDISSEHVSDITVKPSYGGVDIYRLGLYSGSRKSIEEFIQDYLVQVKWVFPVMIDGKYIK